MERQARETNSRTVGVVVAAHAPLAGALVQTAQRIVGTQLPGPAITIEPVEIQPDDAPAELFNKVAEAIRRADQSAGVLVLADLFGGSAANVALSQLGDEKVEVVTGANLAMVLEAVGQARRHKPLHEIAARSAESARSSVVVAGELLNPRALGANGDGVANAA